MAISQRTASYGFIIPVIEQSGNWGYICEAGDKSNKKKTTAPFIQQCLREGGKP